MESKNVSRWVVVTTTSRGVFYGRVDDKTWKLLIDPNKKVEKVLLLNARNVFYWVCASNAKGICSLATTGPQAGSKIGPAVSELLVTNVSAVMACNPKSRNNWENSNWNS